ncbi:MAG: HAMP domain-containing sensor histidine kinase [Pseudomonadota bacterium]
MKTLLISVFSLLLCLALGAMGEIVPGAWRADLSTIPPHTISSTLAKPEELIVGLLVQASPRTGAESIDRSLSDVEGDAGVHDPVQSPEFHKTPMRWFDRPAHFWTAHQSLLLAIKSLGLVAIMVLASVTMLRARMRERVLREAEKRVEMEREMTAQIAAERRLLEERNRDLEDLFHVVSHDLSAPIVSIAGFVRKLQRDQATGRQDRIADSIASIARNTATMERIVRGAAELDRAAHAPLTRQPIDWSELQRDLHSALASVFEAQGARLAMEAMPPCEADKTMLLRALQNLVENALIHGCPEAGMTVRIRHLREGATLYIGVEDAGPGIPAAFQERIFTPYQRLDPEHPGQGVGLSVVRRVATRHGGRAIVVSQPGRGATFWIGLGGQDTAPAHRRAMPSAGVPTAYAEQPAPGRLDRGSAARRSGQTGGGAQAG